MAPEIKQMDNLMPFMRTSALALAALLQRVGSPPAADGMPMQKQLTHSPNSEEKNSSGSLHISHGGGDSRKHPDPEYPGCMSVRVDYSGG